MPARMSNRRKLAIAAWSAPREPNIYGKLTVDAGPALRYLDELRAATGERVTITHFVGKAVGRALAGSELNGRLRLGRYVPHDDVAIAFLVSMPDGSDLMRAKVTAVDRRSVVDIARELRERAERLRDGGDPDWERTKGVVRRLPTWLLSPLLRLTGLLGNSLGLDLRGLGVQRFDFGSAVITSVGMFGLDEAFVPPTPFARVPLYVLIGAVRERPAVVDGAITVRPELTLTATIDHRFVDGFQGGVLAREVRRAFADPGLLDEPDPRAPSLEPTP